MIYFQVKVQEVSSKDSLMSDAGTKYHFDKSDIELFFLYKIGIAFIFFLLQLLTSLVSAKIAHS